MGYELKFRHEAVLEIEQAFDYYLNISPQVAYFFDEDLEASFYTLKINPFFQKRIHEYRVLPLSKYPYIIIYQIIEELNIVDIISVFHTSQNPNKYPE